MRLWKTKTCVELTIETTTLFGRRKRHYCYFTHKVKYIYAETKDEAKMKYGDAFFNPAEDGYDKNLLSVSKFTYDTKSLNMIWDLPFNQKIVHTSESIIVHENPVYENIDIIKRNSTGEDFKDWLMNNTNKYYNYEDIDWLDK